MKRLGILVTLLCLLVLCVAITLPIMAMTSSDNTQGDNVAMVTLDPHGILVPVSQQSQNSTATYYILATIAAIPISAMVLFRRNLLTLKERMSTIIRVTQVKISTALASGSQLKFPILA